MTHIFISYRTADREALIYGEDESENAIDFLVEYLRNHYDKATRAKSTGRESGFIFYAEDSINVGDNWQEVLSIKIQYVDVVIVVFGPRWFSEYQRRRNLRTEYSYSEDAHDVALWEVTESLKRGLPVFPIVVGIKLKDFEDQLPEELNAIRDKHYLEVPEKPDLNEPLAKQQYVATIQNELLPNIRRHMDLGPLGTAIHSVAALPDLISHVDLKDLNDIQDLRAAREKQQILRQQAFRFRAIDLMEQLQEFKFIDEEYEKRYCDSLVLVILEAGYELFDMQPHRKKGGRRGRAKQESMTIPNELAMFKERQLEAVLQAAASLLARLDIDMKEDYGLNQLGVLRTGRIPDETVTWHRSDSSQRNHIRYAGHRAISYYHEYRPTGRKVLLEMNKLNISPFRRVSVFWETRLQLTRDTWHEFVSEEVLGGLLLGFLMAIGLAVHRAMQVSFQSTNQYQLGDDVSGCWAFEGAPVPFVGEFGSCVQGLAYEFVLLAFAIVFGFLTASLSQSRVLYRRRINPWVGLGWLSTLFIIAMLLVLMWIDSLEILNIVSESASWPDKAGELWDYRFEAFVPFGAVVVIALPGALVFLTLTSMAAVFAGGRRQRSTPNVDVALTIPATAFGLGIILATFAAVVEKSRTDVTESFLLGMVWGAIIGAILWAGRFARQFFMDQRANTTNRFAKGMLTVVGYRSFHFALLLLISTVIVSNLVGRELWTENNPYLSVASVHPENSSQTYDDFYENFRNWRYGFLGLWISVAVYFGLESVNGKMQKGKDGFDGSL